MSPERPWWGRTWFLLSVAAVVLAGLAGINWWAGDGAADVTSSSSRGDPEGAGCRSQWVDLAQLHSENGNPGGPVPALATRWEEVADEAARLADTATRDDCGAKIAGFAKAWTALENFQYDLGDFDPAADLAIAELDRRHYEGLQDPPAELSPSLKRAFWTIRRETPPAIVDLKPALKGAAELDLENRAAVKAFLRNAGQIKWESVHIQRMVGPYRLIGNAELHEE